MKNKSLLFVLVLLFWAVPSEAQRFEWVRGYAPGENVNIVGSVVDSVGNLYILGSINFNTCWENGSRLLPIVPHGHRPDCGDVLIAKVSPEGNLVWHKVIHGSFTGSDAHDIKKLGDTAFACLVTMPLATDYYYLYYLDTMIQASGSRTDWPDYPMNAKYVNHKCLALITFDFEGNVLEQHFLQMSFLDYNGEDITSPPNTRYGPERWLNIKDVMFPSFDIDNEGNIYLSRWTYDMTSTGPDQLYSVEDGTISAVKFWCDRREVGIAPADSNKHFSPQILKFSPHFDTLLSGKYVYQTRNTNINCWETKLNYHAPHIYARFLLVTNNAQQLIVFDSTNGIQTRVDYNRHAEKGVIIKYDSSLTAVNSIIIEDTITNPATFHVLMFVLLNDIVFDRDSNLAIVSATAHKGIDGIPAQNMDNSFFIINGNYVDFHQNAGIIILDEETLELKSTGQLSTSDNSWNNSQLRTGGNLSCCNNRIFFQATYDGSVQFPNQVSHTPSGSSSGLCLGVFDYSGNCSAGIEYESYSPRNRPGAISIKDSILYLTVLLTSGATFGEIQVPSRGDYFACIAKYVDASFMTPYVSPAVRIRQADSTTVTLFPNPATDRVHVAVTSGEPVTEACVVTLNGIRRRVPVADGTVDLTGVPSGILFLQLVTPTQIYTHKIIKL